MRRPTISRRSAPAAIGGGLVAISVIAGSCVVAVTSGHGSASDAPAPAAARGGAGAARAGLSSGALPWGVPSSGAPSSGALSSGAVWAAGLAGKNAAATALSLPWPVPVAGQPDESAAASASAGATAVSATVPRLVVPDVIASVPGGVTAADLARLRKIAQVRSVLPIAGARITVNGTPLTVVGAPAAELRPWMPPETAASTGVWDAFAKGDLITTSAAASAGGLRRGGTYPVSARVRTRIAFGTSALLGIAGIDGIVDAVQARSLGLVPDVAVLINAPAADMTSLVSEVRAALGGKSQVIRLVSVTVSTKLPVDTTVPAGRPASYLSLYQESAAQYCPGLSWTVLAAIGQIESDDGTNDGPSTAGALGPMQFLPSTWKIWGIDAFGQAGTPDIMNPFDAVPSAARMLCADGAASGGRSLQQAIFDYNHATWYVDEVLTLANEYASEFG